MTTARSLLARIDSGDTLAIDPDVGKPYRATVTRSDRDAGELTVRFDTDRGRQTRTFDVVEVARWYQDARLIINPPDRPRRGRREPPA